MFNPEIYFDFKNKNKKMNYEDTLAKFFNQATIVFQIISNLPDLIEKKESIKSNIFFWDKIFSF